MRALASASICIVCLVSATVAAQPDEPRDRGDDSAVAVALERLMQFDADGDGELTQQELRDARLAKLFERADSDHDGELTKAELTEQLTKESAQRPRRRGGPGFGGPPGGGPGAGPPPEDGAPGPGAPSPGGPAPGGPPPIGRVVPDFLIEALELTDEQRDQLAELQRHVDERLKEILTPEQRQRLQSMRPGGPPPQGIFDGTPDRARPRRRRSPNDDERLRAQPARPRRSGAVQPN